MHTHEEETAAAMRKGHTAAAKQRGGILGTFAEIGCQHINKLRIRWRLRQRASRDLIQHTVIRLSPAGLHNGSQVSLHTIGRCIEVLRCLSIWVLRNQQNALWFFLYLLQHIYREIESRQLSGYTQETQQTFSVQRYVFFKFRNVINERH